MMGDMGMDGGGFDFDRSSMNQGPPPMPMREGPPRRDYDRGYNRDRDMRDRPPPSYEEDEGPIDWRSDMRPREEPPMRRRDREPSFER